jgi:archaellum component FlaF (FlaF/FlaG flagellin family)
MLEKQSVVDKVEVLEFGQVQVRTAMNVLENGAVISTTYKRHMVLPGDNFSAEDDKVKAICAAVHTAEVVAKFKSQQGV